MKNNDVTRTIKINSQEDAVHFVHAITPFPERSELTHDVYVINAKSIMGIFSLDLSNELTLIIHDPVDMAAIDKAISPFIVK